MFAIGEFPPALPGGTAEVAVVHRNWVQSDKIWWPNFWKNRTQLVKAVKAGDRPDPSNWHPYQARVLGNKLFGSYEEALAHLNKSTNQSDFSSNECDPMDVKRNRKRRKSIDNMSGSSESSTPKRTSNSKSRIEGKSRAVNISLPDPPPPPQTFSHAAGTAQLVAVADLYSKQDQPTTNVPLQVGVNPFQNSHDNFSSFQNEIPSTYSGAEPAPQFRTAATPASSHFVSDLVTPRNSKGIPASGGQLDADTNQNSLRSAIQTLQLNQEIIIAKLDTLQTQVRTLLLGNERPCSSADNLVQKLSIPIRTIEEFEHVQESVRNDEDARKYLIQLMEKRGGNNPNQVVHRIIGYLVTDDLLLEFTFHGHKDKKGFKQTAVMECVYEAVRRSRMGSVLTDKEVDKAAEYWVKKAFTRISSREKRMDKQKPQSD